MGGEVRYNARVEEIVINNGTTVGVRLSDGSEHYADYIISAADAYYTVVHLLKSKYMEEETKALVHSNKALLTAVQISLCINCDLSAEPHALAKRFKNPLIIGKKVNTHVCFKNFSFDPILSSSGKTVITSLLATDYEFWEDLHKNYEEYKLDSYIISYLIVFCRNNSKLDRS